MKLGILSDSHDHMENISKSIKIFKEKNVDYIIHLGDFISPNAIKAFHGTRLKGIFGNNDGDRFRMVRAFDHISGEIKGEFYEFQEEGLRFACYHGTDLPLKDALARCGKYDVVFYGHTHKSEKTTVESTLVLNPGTAHGFGEKASIMVFDTNSRQADIIYL